MSADFSASTSTSPLNASPETMKRLVFEITNIWQEIEQLHSSLPQQAQAAALPQLYLPEVVVIGSQSAGKSSLLESLCGHKLFPKGLNMVTKQPIRFKFYTSDEEGGFKATLSCSHTSSEPKFETNSEDELRKKLEAKMKAISTLSENELSVEVHSSNVIHNLTLIDLPGFIRNESKGQNTGIRDQIKTLVRKYSEKPTSIILAVSPGSEDLANSEALHHAKKVDTQGSRTINVMTKIDVSNSTGANVRQFLHGDSEHNFGFANIGVRNIPHEELAKGKSLQAAKKEEQSFLKKHYPAVKDKHGIDVLSAFLHQLIIKKAEEKIGAISIAARQLLISYQEELRAMTSVTAGQLISAFERKYRAAVDGDRKLIPVGNIASFQASLSTQIYSQLLVQLPEEIDKLSHKFRQTLTSETFKHQLKMMVVGSHGRYTPVRGCLPTLLLRELVSPHIADFQGPITSRCSIVSNMLLKAVSAIVQEECGLFPKLASAIEAAMCSMIRKQEQATAEFLKQLVANEAAYINTKHPTFEAALEAVLENQNERPKKKQRTHSETKSSWSFGLFSWAGNNAAEEKQAGDKLIESFTASFDEELIQKQVELYYNLVVRNSLQDASIKAIMTMLVENSCNKGQDLHSLIETSNLSYAELMKRDEQAEKLIHTKKRIVSLLESITTKLWDLKKM